MDQPLEGLRIVLVGQCDRMGGTKIYFKQLVDFHLSQRVHLLVVTDGPKSDPEMQGFLAIRGVSHQDLNLELRGNDLFHPHFSAEKGFLGTCKWNSVNGKLKVDQKRQVKSGPPEHYWTGDYRGGLVRDSGFGSPWGCESEGDCSSFGYFSGYGETGVGFTGVRRVMSVGPARRVLTCLRRK